MTHQQNASLKALFAVIVWGGSFVAIKIAVRTITPIALIWLRFGMGIIILGSAVGFRREYALPEKKDWPYLALLGFLGITFHQWLQSTGLRTSQATTTGWIVASMPVFIAVLGWLTLKEKMTWLQVAGIMVAAFGVILVVTRGNLATLVLGGFGAPGDLLILLSAPNWAVFTILSRRGLQKYPAALMMLYVMMFGWLFASILFVTERGWTTIRALPWNGWLAVAFLGILCSGLAYIYWYDALKALPVAQTGSFLYLEPVVTVIVSFLLLGEKITLSGIIGGLIILFGVWLINRTRPAKVK